MRRGPELQLFRDGCPGGESPEEAAARGDLVATRLRGIEGSVLPFSSEHFLQMLAARWLGLPPEAGRLFLRSTARLSALCYEHNLSQPVIRLWRTTRHIESPQFLIPKTV